MMTNCRYLLCLEREDLLIFLRGITEITQVMEAIRQYSRSQTTLLRKCIVSTNIASLLTPDILVSDTRRANENLSIKHSHYLTSLEEGNVQVILFLK